MSMFIHPYVHRLSSVKVSDPGDIWVQLLKITCLHSNLVLDSFHLPVYIINHMNAQNGYLAPMYLCI